MLAVSEEEWRSAPYAGNTIQCPHCGKEHPIEEAQSVAADGTRSADTLLGFYRCGDDTYLASINGRLLIPK